MRTKNKIILPSHLQLAIVCLLLALHASLAIRGVINRSVTSDETGHITAGYAYWRFNDYRLQPENGNLPQRWGALPLLVAKPALDSKGTADAWAGSNVWNIAQHFLFESGNDADYLLLWSRTTMLAWSLAAGLLVYGWSRHTWGDTAGIGSLALFAVSPTTLAHGPLVTSDMCAAVCLLAALASAWRLCQRPTPTFVLLAGATTGLASVAKFSAVLLLPVYATMLLLALITRREPRERFRLIVGWLTVAVLTGTVIWGFFGFRYAAQNPLTAPFSHFYLPWEAMAAKNGHWTTILNGLRQFHVLPEAFLYGFSFVVYFATERGAFAAGNYSSTGWWWFFPFAFIVKSTIGELIVTVLLAAEGLSKLRRISMNVVQRAFASPLIPLVLFASVYAAISLTSKLNIGQRHILPLYLVLFIFSGALFAPATSKLLRLIAGLAVVASAAEMIANSPNQLAFFNRFAGGPSNGWRLLVDSSLDWGQDVSALARWIKENQHPGERVYVSCFGTADPEYEGIRGESLSPLYSLGKPRHWIDLTGGLYCISATMLQDVYGIRPGPWTSALERDFQYLSTAARHNLAEKTWDRSIPETGFHPEHPLWLLDRLRFARLCQYLRLRRPDAVINHTQFVFRLSNEEVETVTNRPLSSLANLMERAATESKK